MEEDAPASWAESVENTRRRVYRRDLRETGGERVRVEKGKILENEFGRMMWNYESDLVV